MPVMPMSQRFCLALVLAAVWLLHGVAQTRPTEMRPTPAKPKPVAAKPAPAKPATVAKPAPAKPKPAAARPQPATAPRRTAFRPSALEIEMVLVRAGSFLMGSPANEAGRDADETQHRVTLSNDFYLGKYEVTQAQWQAVTGSNPSEFKRCGGNCPVENVSWYDVQEFISKLNGLSGLAYRLPTEAEWEYAARAGTTGPYAGNLDALAWYDGNSGNTTHPAGTKQPNGWGLYDMHGNVWEWCSDWYGNYSAESVTNPGGPGAGSNRVKRGGSWNILAAGARSAFRSSDSPSDRYFLLGFRLARTPS